MSDLHSVSRGDIERAAGVLASGGLVAFPTETVYGLGANASDPEAVARIFSVKGRPTDHPLIVHIANVDGLERWASSVPKIARQLTEVFWPGPLTVLVDRAAWVGDDVTGGRSSVGLRVPDHTVANAVLDSFASLLHDQPAGIAAPSANRFGRVSPTTADHVRADLGADVDLVLDGGPCLVGVESTIVDCRGVVPAVVRLGGISLERLAEVLGALPDVAGPTARSITSGMMPSHYAPQARVVLVALEGLFANVTDQTQRGFRVAVLAPAVVAGLPDEAIELEPAGTADNYARVLYDRLRQADRLGVDVLFVVPPSPDGIGAAVVDRLERASAASDGE